MDRSELAAKTSVRLQCTTPSCIEVKYVLTNTLSSTVVAINSNKINIYFNTSMKYNDKYVSLWSKAKITLNLIQ